MKLVASRIAHADTIILDDGQIVGVIYYGMQPLDDEGTKPADAFRKWCADAEAALTSKSKEKSNGENADHPQKSEG